MYPWQMINTIDYFVYDELKKGQIVKSKINDKNFRLREARTGNAYVGLRVWPAYNEFIIVELNRVLEKDKQYYFEMYVSISPHANCYLRSFGISFYSFKPPYSQKQAINDFTPQLQIYRYNGIRDTTDWIKLAGVFTAEGGERFMSIGNFSSRNSEKFKRRKFSFSKREAYYYIDDVALYQLDKYGYPVFGAEDTLKIAETDADIPAELPLKKKEIDDYYRNIPFPTGSADLNFEAYQKLGFIVEYLLQHTDVRIHIIGTAGNSDNLNIDEQIRLAQKRARSVSMFVTGNRINKNRIFLAFNISGNNEPSEGNHFNNAEILFSNDPDDKIKISLKNFNLMQ